MIDDHPLFRSGVAHILRSTGMFDVVAEGETASDAIRIVRECSPEIILLDLNMPGSGLEAAHQIRATAPSVRIIVVSASEAVETVTACLDAGVQGYLLKGTSGEELVRVLNSVREGEAYIAPQLAARILLANRTLDPIAKKVRNAVMDLSPREFAILKLVAKGQSNKEIARIFGLSDKTVKHYMTSLMQKLHVKSRLEAALCFRDHFSGKARANRTELTAVAIRSSFCS